MFCVFVLYSLVLAYSESGNIVFVYYSMILCVVVYYKSCFDMLGLCKRI